MKTFNTYLTEAEDKVKAAEQKARVAIDGFLAKIEACKRLTLLMQKTSRFAMR